MSPEARRSYSVPLQIWTGVLRKLIAGTPISFARVTQQAIRLVGMHPEFRGLEHIPAEGSFIVLGNHYQRPGFWVAWGVGLTSLAIYRKRREPVHYVIVSEFERIALGPLTFSNPLRGPTRRLFQRIADLAGLVTMPLNPDDKTGRARAMRELAAMLKQGQIAGIFPEADESVSLREARPGSGGFVALLSDNCIPILPVGIYEEGGSPVINFGPTFTMTNKRPRDTDRDAFETRQRITMMTNVARLLPPAMWGVYPPTQESDEQLPL